MSSASPLDPALLERLKGLALTARRVVEGALHGLHRSPFHGLSIEFAQHRAYSPGDELKHLDWRVIARSDRYVIKQYQQETNLRAVIFVDSSRSMAFSGRVLRAAQPAAQRQRAPADEFADDPRDKLHYARRLAAALAYLLLHQGDSVGLVTTNYRTIDQVPPRATPGHLMTICQVLEAARPRGFTDLSGVLNQYATRLKRRSLVVVISDLFDDPQQVLAALGQLHHRGHEVLVFHTLDPREIEFNLGYAARGVTVIRDIETGEEFETEPQLIRKLVRDEINRFLDTLDSGARRHGVHLLRCPTNVPVENVITELVQQRARWKR